MDVKQILNSLIAAKDLSHDEMTFIMTQMMAGELTHAQIAGVLVGLAGKGETTQELIAGVKVLRSKMSAIDLPGEHLIDTCGTGGDASGTFNISTAVSFVLAAAGAQVAKHGNRSNTSSSGSADVLESAGIRLDLTEDQIKASMASHNLAFMFAPQFHPTMKHAVPVRKELGIRTILNLLGPLSNPANAPHQLVGVFDQKWCRPYAECLKALGSRHVCVVHAEDGLDEVSIGAPTDVTELRNNQISNYQIQPEDFGFERASIEILKVGSPDESLAMIRRALNDEPHPARDIVTLNAGVALYTCDLASTIADGVVLAKKILKEKAALQKLEDLVSFSKSL